MTIRRPTIEACVLGVLLAAGAGLTGCRGGGDGASETPDAPPAHATDGPESPATAPEGAAAPAAATEPASAPESAARELAPDTDPDEVEGWRPAWWLEDPMKAQQHAMACAMATNAELAAARAAAVDSARQRLAQFLGYQPGATEMKTDALRLPNGQYRAFVLVQTPIK